jgi:hypothetical protein
MYNVKPVSSFLKLASINLLAVTSFASEKKKHKKLQIIIDWIKVLSL